VGLDRFEFEVFHLLSLLDWRFKIMAMKNRIRVIVFLLIAPLGLFAQTYQTFHQGMNNWYFGNSPNAIKFNRTTNLPTTVNTKAALGTGGSATATDPSNSNLLFYTDGQNVYDATNVVMPAGSGLLGNRSSNQPAAICPVPGQPKKYFIFSNSATNIAAGSITYDIVDLALPGNSIFPSVVPFGEVEVPMIPGTLHASMGLIGRAEAMTIVSHANGTDFWLLSQEANSQNYAATLINAASYNATHTGTFTTQITSGVGLVLSASHFAFSSVQNAVAVAPTSPSIDAFITPFNNSTGAFGIETRIVNSASAGANNQAIYDIEWSGDGHYVYYSVFGDETMSVPGNVFQYDFTMPTISLVSVLPSTVFRSYGLQLAPDSSIYHLYQTASGGPFLIGKISDPDSVATKVNYVPNAFPSITNWNARQFTAVLPLIKPVITVTFLTAGTCSGVPTSFYPTVTPYADSLVWNFGDGNPTVNAWSPIHTYQSTGTGSPTTYDVAVTAYFEGQAYPQTPAQVTINDFQVTLQLVADTTACTFEFPPPKGTDGTFSVKVTAQGGSPTFTWSNGDTGDTLTPDSAGYYYVVTSPDANGCSALAGVNVKEYLVPDQRRNIWYFGNLAGIDFNPPTPVALDDGAMNTAEGCSAMSDRNGDIIFYTNGNTVWDQTHTVIDRGLGGDTLSTESVLIVPVPGDETLYYIFTTEAKEDYPTNTVYYSLFDLKKNNGLGMITQKHIPLYNGSTERLASNGNWLITHEYGNNSFRCYPITATGIGEAVITSIGSDHSFQDPTLAEGYMKIGANSSVAVALSIPGTANWIDVFDFVDSTGVLTNYRKVTLNETAGQVYGVEFSPGGNKLFATVKGSPSPSYVYEYSIDSVSQLHFKQKVSNASELGAIQIAPDGQIYIAINGSSSLGTVTVNEDTTALSTFNFAGFALAGGTTSTLGLPSFVQSTGNAFGGPGMFVAGVCFGTPMDYIATPTDPIDTFLWGFGDSSTSTLESGQHSYTAPGTYTIVLEINNRCLIHDGTPPYSFSQSVTIVNPPAPPTIPASSAICTTAIVLDANTGAVPSLTYLWSTTETTRQISVITPAVYSVTITDAFGCTSTGSTDVNDGRPVVDLGADLTLCQGSPQPTLDTQNLSPTFTNVWTNGNTTPTQTVSTATPGTTTYQVTVTNTITSCTITDAATFIITESPHFTLAQIPASNCATDDGQINVTITALTQTTQPPIHTFEISGVGLTRTAQPTGVHNYPGPSDPPLGDGFYVVTVEDEISGCGFTQGISIIAGTNTLTVTPPPNVCPPTTTPVAANTDATTPNTYQIFDSAGVPAGNGSNVTGNFNTVPLGAGTYTLQITKSGCIVATQPNIVIGQDPNKPFTVTSNACTSPQTITASPVAAGLTYNWTVVGATSGTSNEVISFTRSPGTYSYDVTGTQAGFCFTPQTISITIGTIINPALSQDSECQSTVTLSATPVSGTYTYYWYKGGSATPDASLAGPQILLTTADNNIDYEVAVTDPSTGCTSVKSPVLTASVIGPINADIIPPNSVCSDGNPFTLTASTSAATATYKWYFDDGTGYSNLTGETSSTTIQSDPGDYKVEITAGTCVEEATEPITRANFPVGNLPNQVTICDDPKNVDDDTNHFDLDPNPGVPATYEWFMKKTDASTETSLSYTDQVYTVTKKGIYRVEITNAFNCTAEDITVVLNDCVPKIVAPNAFRPASGITENKAFDISGYFIEDGGFQLFIYNRWGEMVYQSSELTLDPDCNCYKLGEKWNGGYNNNAGTPLPSGVYAYVIHYVSVYRPDKGIQEKRGGIMLVR
jgi:large repetitive protein